jgi:hypothetical protein
MSAKDIIIEPVNSSRANTFIEQHHYSGTVVPNSQLHLGAFLRGSLEGVLQFGPPLDRENVIGLVEDTGWNEMMELNRMAFTDKLPKNSGSRCLSIAFKLFKKHAPHVKWVLSYADATQCGDGAVYRASNFVLTGIKENVHLIEFPNGETLNQIIATAHSTDPRPELNGKSVSEVTDGKCTLKSLMNATGAEKIPGYQLRYIYFIDKEWRDRLTVDEIPYSRIDELGAGMYKGEPISVEARKPDN